jgi:hypothetical protein
LLARLRSSSRGLILQSRVLHHLVLTRVSDHSGHLTTLVLALSRIHRLIGIHGVFPEVILLSEELLDLLTDSFKSPTARHYELELLCGTPIHQDGLPSSHVLLCAIWICITCHHICLQGRGFN